MFPSILTDYDEVFEPYDKMGFKPINYHKVKSVAYFILSLALCFYIYEIYISIGIVDMVFCVELLLIFSFILTLTMSSVEFLIGTVEGEYEDDD